MVDKFKRILRVDSDEDTEDLHNKYKVFLFSILRRRNGAIWERFLTYILEMFSLISSCLFPDASNFNS